MKQKFKKVVSLCYHCTYDYPKLILHFMETMTAAAPKRTYITRVHRSLAEKIGNEGADTLTNYLEDVIPAQIEDKIKYLATKEDAANIALKISGDISTVRGEIGDVKADLKEDVAKVEQKLSGDIANVRADLKEDIAKVKEDVANVRTEVAKVEQKLSGDIANVRADLKEDIAKVKQDVANVRTDLKEDIAKVKEDVANVRTEVAKVEQTLSGDIAKVEVKVAQLETQITQVKGEKDTILNVQLKMEESLKGQIKWVLVTIITIALGALVLYVKNK